MLILSSNNSIINFWRLMAAGIANEGEKAEYRKNQDFLCTEYFWNANQHNKSQSYLYYMCIY